MTQPPQNTLHPEVEKFVLGVSAKYRNHDELTAENTALRNRAQIAEGMLTQIKEQLAEITEQRDRYMRKSMEQSTRFSAAMDILSGLMETERGSDKSLPRDLPPLEE
jgi:hypothetical protein